MPTSGPRLVHDAVLVSYISQASSSHRWWLSDRQVSPVLSKSFSKMIYTGTERIVLVFLYNVTQYQLDPHTLPVSFTAQFVLILIFKSSFLNNLIWIDATPRSILNIYVHTAGSCFPLCKYVQAFPVKHKIKLPIPIPCHIQVPVFSFLFPSPNLCLLFQ